MRSKQNLQRNFLDIRQPSHFNIFLIQSISCYEACYPMERCCYLTGVPLTSTLRTLSWFPGNHCGHRGFHDEWCKKNVMQQQIWWRHSEMQWRKDLIKVTYSILKHAKSCFLVYLTNLTQPPLRLPPPFQTMSVFKILNSPLNFGKSWLPK